jgi:3-oxoacyl-[acyl-carrier protein] reductase
VVVFGGDADEKRQTLHMKKFGSRMAHRTRTAAKAATDKGLLLTAGSRATGIRADVTKRAEIEALFAAARAQFGGLDEGLGPVLGVTETDHDRMFNVNAKGAFFTVQQAARLVNGGSIMYIGSGSTLRPVAGFGLYASSKLPASNLVGVLAKETGERGVTVSAVIASATEGTGYFTVGNDDSQLRSRVRNARPLGSRMGSVDDVADAVEFFTGALARWISGQQVLVSGGTPG